MVSDDWAPTDTFDGSSAGVSAEDSIPLRSRRLLAETAAAPEHREFHVYLLTSFIHLITIIKYIIFM